MYSVGYFGNLVRNGRQHTDAFKSLGKRVDALESAVQKNTEISKENQIIMKSFQRFLLKHKNISFSLSLPLNNNKKILTQILDNEGRKIGKILPCQFK